MSYPAPAAVMPTPSYGVAARLGARRLRALIELSKPRLALMSVLTTAVAHHATGAIPAGQAVSVFFGTLLSAGGALAFNEWRERDADALMQRTRSRPLPAQELGPGLAFTWSLGLSLAGVAWLAQTAGALSALLSAATILIYGFIYTPLKRRTRWATEIGAISGALPPLIGSAAGLGRIDATGALLFAILLCWQMPHFFAIGWIHRRDYRGAGFALLPAVDDTGARVGAWCVAYTITLSLVTVAGWALHAGGGLFFVVSIAGNAWMLRASWRLAAAKSDRDRAAKRLFLVTLAYLPSCLLAILVEHRVF